MSSNLTPNNLCQWPIEVDRYLQQGNYRPAARIYERAISEQPEVKSHYWYLGLLLLLQGEEEEAHTTWLLGMLDAESEEINRRTAELVAVLKTEAKRREEIGENQLAWLIRQHIREILPEDIQNLLQLMQLAIKQETLTEEEVNSWGLLELLNIAPTEFVNTDLLLQVVQSLLCFAPLHPYSRKFTAACLPHLAENKQFTKIILETAQTIAYQLYQPTQATKLAELCMSQNSAKDSAEFLAHLTGLYDYSGNYALGIETAKKCYSRCDNLPDRIFALYLLLKSLLGAVGYWQETKSTLQQQDGLLLSLLEDNEAEKNYKSRILRLLTIAFLYPYLRDNPQQNRKLQNSLAQIHQRITHQLFREKIEQYHQTAYQRKTQAIQYTRPLKIGYISHCLRKHSVGWLSRSLFEYRNRNQFLIYSYFINYNPMPDSLQQWYVNNSDQSYQIRANSNYIAQQIADDEIDILIDLDSLTLDTTVGVMAMKPAPIQITWLGWDATGLPAIDYFLADPYVLPENAQNYYTEKIWRLPQTYIATDGFDVGIPTLRREDLDIPANAVVYYSGQKGYKRNPDNIKSQLKIIKAVPNSYFLIKTRGDEAAEKIFFYQLAAAEGIEEFRLKFLPTDPTEEIHRANLEIADVVLDTYPYNGATTTVETLWMGIPLVTRVGQQFSARNSYSIMLNAGITEGIAWTDEEYVEWGICLGLDAELRQDISWRLRQGRQTAPLWNGQEFTKQMEQAYEEMWQIYLES